MVINVAAEAEVSGLGITEDSESIALRKTTVPRTLLFDSKFINI